MSVLPLAIVMSLATHCQTVVSPQTIVAIAKVESGFDPAIVHVNVNRSSDVGLMQINSANFGWLGLTERTALDPCQSIRAAGDLMASYSRYNTGSPTSGVANGYAAKVIAASASLRGVDAVGTATAEQCPAIDPDGWHVRAVPAHCHDDTDGWHVARR